MTVPSDKACRFVCVIATVQCCMVAMTWNVSFSSVEQSDSDKTCFLAHHTSQSPARVKSQKSLSQGISFYLNCMF